MIKRVKFNKKTLIRWKIYIDRARMYVGYLQFLMIGKVFIDSYKDDGIGKLINSNLYISMPLLFIAFIAVSLVLGYIDARLGIREEEQRHISNTNPILMEILKSVKELKEERKTKP